MDAANHLHDCAEQLEDGEKPAGTVAPQADVATPLAAGNVCVGNDKKTLSVGVCAMDVKVNEPAIVCFLR